MERYQRLSQGIHFAVKRIQGDRNYQEDDFAIDAQHPNDFLMVLADGMGGETGGAQASELAMQTFMEVYIASHNSQASIPDRLYQALQQTNQRLSAEIEAKPELDGMGCTLVSVAIDFNQGKLYWISVGDSPLWLYQGGRFRRLNVDHSMRAILAKQVKQGELSQEAANTHPDRNMLRSAVTGHDIELIDYSTHPTSLYEGDLVLLASDGLLTLSNQEIIAILERESSAQDTTDGLINAIRVKNKKGQDNTTVLVATLAKTAATSKPAKKNKTGKVDYDKLFKIGLFFTFFIVIVLGSLIIFEHFKPPKIEEQNILPTDTNIIPLTPPQIQPEDDTAKRLENDDETTTTTDDPKVVPEDIVKSPDVTQTQEEEQEKNPKDSSDELSNEKVQIPSSDDPNVWVPETANGRPLPEKEIAENAAAEAESETEESETTPEDTAEESSDVVPPPEKKIPTTEEPTLWEKFLNYFNSEK